MLPQLFLLPRRKSNLHSVHLHRKMATAITGTRHSIRNLTKCIRSFSTHHNNHQQTHQYTESNSFLGSWNAPKDPKDAERKLAQLRREYAKQVKEVRKEYVQDVELLRLEKLRKDEARMLALRAANEERRLLKAETAKIRAQERMIAQEEFKQTLLKERAEKLENWKMKEEKMKVKKKEKKELIRRQTSLWVEEQQLEKKILEALVETTPL